MTERAAALQALAGEMHKRIALERQAFGIDEDGRRPDTYDEINIVLVPANNRFEDDNDESQG